MRIYVSGYHHLHTPKNAIQRGYDKNFGLVYILNFKQALQYKRYLKSVGLTIIKHFNISGCFKVV